MTKPLLRVCASCEWIFKTGGVECPACGFGSYGARWVYGDKCYTYAKTQEPWKNKRMFQKEQEVEKERITNLRMEKRKSPQGFNI